MDVEPIKTEDLHPQLKETLEETPKAFKKFHTLADRLVKKVNGRIEAERDILRKKISSGQENLQKFIDKFVDDVNKDIEAFKKRYEAMYTHLVRDVMLKQEQRVFSAELFEQATLDLFVEKMYRLEKGIADDVELKDTDIEFRAYIEDCAKKHEGFMQKHANAFAKKQQEERDAAMALEKEKENGEDNNSDGGKDEVGSDSNPEEGGTTTPEDSGPTEPSPEEGQS